MTQDTGRGFDGLMVIFIVVMLLGLIILPLVIAL